MPFDGSSQSALTETIRPVGGTLAALGIQAVSRKVVKAHQKKVLREYAEQGPYEAFMVATHRAYWRVTKPLTAANFKSVKQMLRNPVGTIALDKSGAPNEIIALAELVHQHIQPAAFTVGYFYDDPILKVFYIDDHGNEHNECLGIWDHGRVVAIADTSGLVVSQRRWHHGPLELVVVSLMISSILISSVVF